MKRLIFLLAFMAEGWAYASAPTTAYTEFYCNSGGTNINAGSTTNATPTFTATAGYWTNSTATWFKSGANLSAVTVGMWAAVCTNSQTNAVFISRIIAVDDTADTIQLSTTAIGGTDPVNDNAGVTTISVEGAWAGAHHATAFPWNFVAGTMTNVSGNNPRVNIQSGYSNSITAAISHTIAGPITFQGYTSIAGDGGKGIIDAGGGGFIPLTISATGIKLADLIVQNNSTAQVGITLNGTGCVCNRVVARSIGNSGFLAAIAADLIECEAYNCNTANTAAHGGFKTSVAGSSFLRCWSHDNTGSTSQGFQAANTGAYINCLSVSNGYNGFNYTLAAANGLIELIGCESVGNGSNGVEFTSTSLQDIYIENCNIIANGKWGIASATNGLRTGSIVNCGFGTGTMANALGDFTPNIGTTNGLLVTGCFSYASGVTPYVDYAHGNFGITNTSAAFGTGRGNFTQLLVNSPTNTVSYPNVGATVYTNSASTTYVTNTITVTNGSGGSHTFMQ